MKILKYFSLMYEPHLTSSNTNLSHEWNEYISPAKRPHHLLLTSSSTSSTIPHLYSTTNHPSLFEYQNGIHTHPDQMVNEQKIYIHFYLYWILIQNCNCRAIHHAYCCVWLSKINLSLDLIACHLLSYFMGNGSLSKFAYFRVHRNILLS